MSEGDMSSRSDRSSVGLPNTSNLVLPPAGQVHITCIIVSSSSIQSRHSASSTSPILCRCDLSRQWPVYTAVSVRAPFLPAFRSSSVLRLDGPARIVLACSIPGLSYQSRIVTPLTHSQSLSLARFFGTLSVGSGPTNGEPAPVLARESARSFPSRPTCPGIHISDTLFPSPNILSSFLQ